MRESGFLSDNKILPGQEKGNGFRFNENERTGLTGVPEREGPGP